MAWGMFNNYVMLKLPFFDPPTPSHHASSPLMLCHTWRRTCSMAWGMFNNYVTLKLPFFDPPTPSHHASSPLMLCHTWRRTCSALAGMTCLGGKFEIFEILCVVDGSKMFLSWFSIVNLENQYRRSGESISLNLLGFL